MDDFKTPQRQQSSRPQREARPAARGGRLWIATRDAATLESFQELLAAAGLTACVASSVEELLREPDLREGGLAFLDERLLAGGRGADLAHLKAAGVALVLFRGLDDSTQGRAVFSLPATGSAKPPALQAAFMAAPLPKRRAARGALVSPGGGIKAEPRSGLAWVRAGGAWRPTRRLTPTEFSLLCLLLTYPRQRLDRAFIMRRLLGERAEGVNAETLSKHVQTLRDKLGPARRSVRTVYGKGYLLVD